MNTEKEQEVIERLVIAEQRSRSNTHRLDEQDVRITKLEDNTNMIHKMNVMLEVQMEANKMAKEEVGLLKTVVNSVNENLTNLNHTQEKLSDKLDQVVQRVDKVDKRIDGIEDKHEEHIDELESEKKKIIEEDSISIKKVFYNVIKWIFYSMPVSVLGAIILYYVSEFLK